MVAEEGIESKPREEAIEDRHSADAARGEHESLVPRVPAGPPRGFLSVHRIPPRRVGRGRGRRARARPGVAVAPTTAFVRAIMVAIVEESSARESGEKVT
jgi:hypothetical protein